MYVLVEIHNGMSTRASMSITIINIIQELAMMHLVLALKLTRLPLE